MRSGCPPPWNGHIFSFLFGKKKRPYSLIPLLLISKRGQLPYTVIKPPKAQKKLSGVSTTYIKFGAESIRINT